MMQIDWLAILLIVVFIVLVAMAIKKRTGGYLGGYLGGYTGGTNAEGFFYANEGDLDELKLNGSGIVKNKKVKKGVDVNGSLQMMHSEVAGDTSVVGTAQISNSQLKSLSLKGDGNVYKSNVKKINLCGKLKIKESNVGELVIDEKCKMEGVNMPYVVLKGSTVDKIVVPKGMKEDEVIEKK